MKMIAMREYTLIMISPVAFSQHNHYMILNHLHDLIHPKYHRCNPDQ